MKKLYQLFVVIFLSLGFLFSCSTKSERLFVGGFTKPDAKGLSVFDFNPRNGDLKLISEAQVGPNPAYFCYSQKSNLFYVANEVMEFNGTFGGGLTTYKYKAEDASFEKLNEMLIPYGGPCYISLSPDSSHLLIANYPNGSVAVVKLDNTGIPSALTDTILYNKSAPDESHAHMILSDPSGKKIYVTDLGLDRVIVYDFDKNTGQLSQSENGFVQLPDGIGPRHFVFNPNGSVLYVINELGSKMLVFKIKKNEEPGLVQILPTTRSDFEGNNYCADVHMSKDGKFVYGSNRGENTIVTYKVEEDGTLTLAGHTSCGGDWPRNFVVDPTGKFLLVGNQKSDSISVFRLNKKTGLPIEPGKDFLSPAPACLKFFE